MYFYEFFSNYTGSSIKQLVDKLEKLIEEHNSIAKEEEYFKFNGSTGELFQGNEKYQAAKENLNITKREAMRIANKKGVPWRQMKTYDFGFYEFYDSSGKNIYSINGNGEMYDYRTNPKKTTHLTLEELYEILKYKEPYKSILF